MNGSHQERLPIFTMAKEMSIDSINAYIYWSSGLAIECAHLNGSDRFAYYPMDAFFGKQGTIYILFSVSCSNSLGFSCL